MDLGNGLGHLTYSTLVHPGDNWEQMWSSLNTYLPKVKARIAGNQPFGVSLRLSAESAQTLVSKQAERDRLKKFLGDHDMYLYTVNAFPYGAFKGTVVKEQVYEPDWRSEERTRYTMNVATVLADVCPAEIAPSIQSAPLGFKPRVTGGEVVASYTDHVLRVVAHLVALEAQTGRTVTLALEPEPYCFLETTDETIAYFTGQLYSGAAAESLARLAHIPVAEAHGALRRHLGVVFDICHQAVEYEDIAENLQKLVDAGIPIFKLQEAAALHMPQVTQAIVDTLKRYAKTIYLTQTVEKKTTSSRASLISKTPSPPGRRTPGRGNGELTSTFRYSLTILARSAPRVSRSRKRCAFTNRSRCRASSRSRLTPGTSCRRISRLAISSIMFAVSSNGCAGS
jgi:hypothetical protein